MAAALLDRYAHGQVHVRSAGSTPADEINPAVVQAVEEVGVDLSKEFPTPPYASRQWQEGSAMESRVGIQTTDEDLIRDLSATDGKTVGLSSGVSFTYEAAEGPKDFHWRP